MYWCIESVKTNLQAFSESLIAQGVDARFAVIDFSDAINYPGSTQIYQLESGSWWTSDISLLEAGLDRAIQACYSNPGWDETQNDACYTLLNTLSSTFRKDASCFAFLLTDEGNNTVAGDPRLQSISVYASMLKSRNIRTSVISLMSLQHEFKVLSDTTDGMYIDLQSSDYYKVMLGIADWIADVTGLTIHVMERATVSDTDETSTPNLICDARNPNGYNDDKGSRITEKKLANITTPEPYIKKGYTADGNTRLIIRVQHNRPGKVYFDVDSEFGTLEDLNRRKITASSPVATTEIQEGKLYQATAVLVAPENFPLKKKALGFIGDDGFPKRDFEVKVKFECACGDAGCTCEDEEEPVKLEIHATPVVFIHGIYGTFAGAFVGKGKSGIFKKLSDSDVAISYWNYANTEGPTSQIIDKVAKGEHSGLFNVITQMFRRMLKQHNIACTRVDIICHSMGGLMARTFLEYDDKSSSRSYYNSMVRRLITIATPHEGSPTTNYLLEGGEKLPYITKHQLSTLDEPHKKVVRIFTDSNFLESVRYATRNILDGSEGAVNAIGAWTDLALGSTLVNKLKSVGIPPVPTHVVYGTIRNGTEALFNLIHKIMTSKLSRSTQQIIEARTGRDISEILEALVPAELHAILQEAPFLLDKYENFYALLDVLFDEEDYDIAVGEDSAVSIFDQKYITHKDSGSFLGLNDIGEIIRVMSYNHTGICMQNNVGDEVLDLLKGDLSKFDTSGVGKSSAQSSNSYSTNSFTANSFTVKTPASSAQSYIPADTQAVSDYFLKKYALSAVTWDGSDNDAPAQFNVKGSTDIIFTLTADEPVENNIYLSIGNEQGGFFLQMESTDNTQMNFTALMPLPSAYTGTMNIHAFSSPNAADEGHVYISDTLGINIVPEIDNSDPIKELSFTSSGVIIASVSADIGLNLFAVTSEGIYVDVSVPAVANELGISCTFTDSSIAEITENGKIRGLKSGSTTLKASYNSLETSVSVDVDVEYPISPIPQETSKDLFITTSSIQDGKAGLSYTQILESTLSFTDPILWTVSGLPAGLVCGNDGIITGKPLTAGNYSLDIMASSDTETDSKTLSLSISPSDNPYAPIISTLSIPPATVSRDYKAVISAIASGDTSEMRWNITFSGNAPEGLNIDSFTGPSVTISGIPKKADTFIFMMQVSLNGYSDMQSFTLVINPLEAPVITSSSLPDGVKGTPYSASLIASGTQPITWGILGGSLPDGLKLSADTGVISGTPEASGDFSFTVSAKNDGGTTSKDFAINITASKPAPQPVPPSETPKDSEPSEQKEEKEKAVRGSARGVSSLSAGQLAVVSNDRMMIAAILPEITVNVSDFYDFNEVKISSDVPVGAVLVWNPFARVSESEAIVSDAEDNSGVQFMDEEGKEVTAVPEGRVIDVSAYLEGGMTYAPVISAYISADKASSGVNGSSGGCTAGISGALLLSALSIYLSRKK